MPEFNDPNVQEWLAHHSVPVDDDGIPRAAGAPGPPQKCALCACLAESPTIGYGSCGGIDAEFPTCAACFRLVHTDPKEYWRRVRKALGVKE